MNSWKQQLKNNFTNLKALADFLELRDNDREKLLEKCRFVLNVPYRLAQKMVKGTLDDPIFRQFVPLKEELQVQNGFVPDPVQDQTFIKSEKLIQKYQGRALVISTSACAMHCRYCFRQNFPYETSRKDFSDEIEQVKKDTSLREVILSGGDPLSLPDEKLRPLLEALDQVPHIKRIRFHSRFPIGIPERIDESFLSIVGKLKKQVWFVTHANHAKEFDEEVLFAFKKLQKLGIPVMNQAVLLKGVNDSLVTLKELSDLLADNGILFYYLHQLDRVQGAGHFEVDRKLGKALVKDLQENCSGYQVPKYVEEIAGEPSKTPI